MVPVSDPLSPALERVLLRYFSLVRGAARRRGIHDDEVEEVVQEVRIRLWKALGSGERIERANTSYIYQTAMSAVSDLLRRRRQSPNEDLEATTEAERMEWTGGPDADLDASELGGQVARALGRLETAKRAVVRMYLAGYPQREIEALLGWSEGKTRNVLYRALGELRNALRSQGITSGVER
jgi:RNA polymerase sigma-70 factor (ECF subfamily)